MNSSNNIMSKIPGIPNNFSHYFEGEFQERFCTSVSKLPQRWDNIVTLILITGSSVEAAFVEAIILAMNTTKSPTQMKKFAEDFSCKPCQPGCESCTDDTPCFVSHDVVLRSTALGFQSFCATLCLLLAFAVCRLRRDKVCLDNHCKSILWLTIYHCQWKEFLNEDSAFKILFVSRL